jgi:hypothetical protein
MAVSQVDSGGERFKLAVICLYRPAAAQFTLAKGD